MSLGHSALQRHFLAARPWIIEEAVRMGIECLQLHCQTTCVDVATYDDEDSEGDGRVKDS